MMPVKVEWHGDDFEKAFFVEVGKEVTRASTIFQANMSDVLRSEGQSPPPSPDGSNIPYVDSGDLWKSWRVSKSKRKGGIVIATIYTTVAYAFWLLIRQAKPKKDGTMGKSGRRDYMAKHLIWYQRTLAMIRKRLDSQRMIKTALRNMK